MTTNPVVLIILDGWGITQPSIGNAISLSKLDYWNLLIKNYPTFLLQASGEAVGLPYGEMGNSEVGHLTIGSGQIVLQSLNRINREVLNGGFFKNEILLKTMSHVKNSNSSLHIIGMIGTGGVHSHQAHLEALIKMASDSNLERVYLHLFLDGRDTAKNKGLEFIRELEKTIRLYNCGQITTLSGRFYGMDRNNNWNRIKSSYDAIFHAQAKEYYNDPILAIQSSYAKNIFDEEFNPVVIGDKESPIKVMDNDAIIFFNFRADRARQLTQAMSLDDFLEFDRGDRPKNVFISTFTEYKSDFPVEVAFRRKDINDTLCEVISSNNLSQLHIAETEKYAHVTFFFNGLKEEKLKGENRILIPSPNVETYDMKPEMSSQEITQNLINSINKKEFDFSVVNFANADMVGHTGNLSAARQAVLEIDRSLSKIIPEVLSQNGTVFVTADHGNVEEVVNLKTGEIDKEHSNFPVPFITINNKTHGKGYNLNNDILYKQDISGVLSDIAPTVLARFKLRPSSNMKGIDLVRGIL
ncbi:MAG: 2,3-bisphosphoglycerate-independent phosphoglycerate mutase [Patescibacteria group bacterium]|nr:2,3-bisphosphoglycerate-independent phosphoglycerate mutase [Patescibacteria group bacterium]MDD4303990.1 2,3-bisphosphoglycerate-independent phosphoglycerate mutase [Patescibacteria group bacterium]MDD4695021.1 2,3-bisphosphoglycerate-independent phosphoglycerate mutase [Patescibacteria group bacterium]